MRQVFAVVCATIIVLAQVSFLPAWRPLGIVPGLVLVTVVLVGLRATVSTALVLALVGGLVMDVAGGSQLGLHAGILSLVALTSGVVRRSGVGLLGPWAALGLVAVGTILSAMILLASLGSGAVALPLATSLRFLAIELVVNLLLMLALQPLVHRIVTDDTNVPRTAS